MDSLFLLVPVAVVFCAIGIRLLFWAVDDGQYEDLDKEAWRILGDDEIIESSCSKQHKSEPGTDGSQ